MNFLAVVAGISVFAGMACTSRRNITVGATCMPLDATADALLAGSRRLASDTAPEVVAIRNKRKIPSTSPGSVSFVTDDVICSKAEAAYTAAVIRTPPATPSQTVRVFKIGNVFVVHDTAQTSGRYYVAMTLSKSYKVLAQYLQ